MAIMNQANFDFDRLILTLIFGIRASEPPPPLPEGMANDRKGRA